MIDPLGIYEAPKSKEDQQSDRLFNDLVKEQHNAAPSNNPSSSTPAMQVGPQKTTYIPNLMGGPLGVISIDRGNNKISNVEDNASPARVLGTIAGSMAATPGAGVEAATKLIPRISTDPNAPWYKLESGSLKEAQQTLDKRMGAMNFIKTPEDAQGLEALNKVMSYIPEKAGKGLGMVGQIINNALKDPNMPQDEDPIPILEPFLSSIGEVSAIFGLFGIFDEIKNSSAYRRLTIPERRIIIKDFADTMKKNPNMSEADLLRKAGPGSDLWNAKLNELRVKSEPTDLTDQTIIKNQEITPEPSPDEPIDLTDLKSSPTKPVPKAEPEPQPTPEEINREAQKFMGEEVNLTDEEAKSPLSQEEIDNASRLRENQGSEIPEESGQLGSQTSQGEYVQGNEGPPIQERPGIGGQNMELQPEQSARGEGQQLAPELDPLNINGNIDIDRQAHQAATSPQNEIPEPSQAQLKAGNYKKAHINLHGLDISIENPKGSVRKGIDKNGKPWKNEMTSHYGYIRRTVGGENEQLDVFVGPKPESEKVYVVKQINPDTNKFDENKVLMGYENEKKARIGYLSNYKKGWKGLGSIQEFSINEFKDWLKNGDQTKPAEKNNVEIPELNSTEDAIAFSKVASDAQLKRVAALREEVEAQRKKIMDEAMAANKQGKRAKANELINEGTRLATRAQLLRETLEAKAKPGRMENTARSRNENLSSSEKSIDEVINNPKASQKEVIAEKIKLKSQVVAGIKSGEFDGAVRFGTVDEIKSILKNGYMPVSSEYGAIHAQPILGKNDDVFAAYGSYEKHNMALVFPKDSIIKKIDAHTKEVLIDSNVDVKKVKFLIDGHKKIYSFNELKDAINSKNAPGSTISPKPVQEVAGGEVQQAATVGRGEKAGEKKRAEMPIPNFKTYDEAQTAIDEYETKLMDQGKTDAEMDSDPYLNKLYDARDNIGQSELEQSSSEISNIIKKETNDNELTNKILKNIYNIDTTSKTGQYFASEYTQKQVKDRERTLELIFNAVKEDYGRKNNLDMDGVFSEISGLTRKGQINLLKKLTDKAAKIETAVYEYFNGKQPDNIKPSIEKKQIGSPSPQAEVKGTETKNVKAEESKVPKSAPQSTKEETKATTPGMVRLDKGGVKPFTEYREIKRGKDSGKVEITLAIGKKVKVQPEQIREYPSQEPGKKYAISKTQKEKLQGVTKQDIQKAFPGSKIWQNVTLKFDDKSITGFFVELPNGKQLLIDPQNDFIVGDIDQIAKDYGQTPDEIKRKFASDEARINGAFTPRNGVSLIELASWSDPGDLSHEKFHFLFNLLKREDRANIFKKYGSEEKAAEAFRIKENYTKSFWEKILHTLRRIKDKIFGDVFKPIFDKLKEERGSISFKNKNAENVESWINEKGTKENQISTPEEESRGLAKLYTPGLEKILEPFKEIKGSLESLLIPTNKSPEHLKAAEVLGKNLGSMGRDAEIANNTLKDASKLFNRLKVHDPNMPDNQNPGLKFMSDMSMGRRMSDTMNKLKIMANTFFKDRLDKLEAADVPLQTVRENYFPGMWTWESRRAFNQAMAEAVEKYPVIADKIHMLSDKQKAVIKNRVNQLLKQGKGSDKNGLEYLSKRPFKGKESFRKQKVFDDIMSGIDLGLRPISNNPIDIIRLKLAEMDRSIMANRAIKEWKEKGDIQFLKSGKNIPEGFAKIDDRYGTVYGPPEVLTSEYVDQNIYNALSKTAKNLGVSHQRKMNAGRGRLGAYSPLEGIKTQYATELGIFGHEIGHALDQKYNLWNSIVKDARGIGKRGNITKGATQKLQATIQNELRALSDLTWEGKAPSKYFKQKVRTKAEKIAHILEAYTQAPERLMEVAPHVYDAFEKFLKSVPELKPLTEIKAGISYKELQNKINIGGFPIIGQWIAKEAVADVLNNYLSSPLYNNKYIGKVFSAYMGTANLLNQFQLGIGSAFHAGFTTGEAITSQTAGMYKDLYGLIKGNRSITDLYKTTKRIPIGFILNPMEGSKILNEWISPTIDIPIDQKISELPSDNPTRIAMITKAAELAGGGFKMERGLRTDLFQDINKDLNSGMKGKIKLGLKSPFIFSEVMAKPIIDILVPRQKAGIFGELAGRIIDMNPDKTLEELIPEFRQAWNRVDARLGQVRYNRLFIKNWSKNIVQALIRAPGWTGGTIAEIGGSIKDTGKFLNEWVKTKKMPENMPDRIAYTMALFTVFGILGGLLTYAFTGEKPQGKDFWAFRTGGIDEYGRPERMVLPSYMKDVWAYSRNPKEVILNKTHPLIGLIKDIAQNEDYYGVKIYNEDDPFIIRQIEKGQYILKQFTPFWLRGAKKESDRSGGFLETLKKHPMKLIGPEFGVMPAPSTYTRSEFEDWAFKISREKNRGLRTKKQFEKSQVKRQLEMALRRKDKDAGIKLNDALKNGSITYRDKLDIQRKAKEDPIEKTAKYLSLENLAYGIQYANDKELLKIIPIFRKKYINKISNRSMSQEDRLRFRNILDNLNQKYNELKRNQK